MASTDDSPLRLKLRGLIGALKDYATHGCLPELCQYLGLPSPSGEGSKRDRLYASFDSISDDDLVHVATAYLSRFPPDAETRNELQELIWADTPVPEVPVRFRREVANSLEDQDLYLRSSPFIELLQSLFVLEGPFDFFTQSTHNLRWQVEQHVVRNKDWTADQLFEKLGAYTSSDKRYLLLLEGLSSAEVRPDLEQQKRFVSLLNDALKPCQVELQETGDAGGYPVFTAVPMGKGVHTSPKNLIFASKIKPDLRFCDAINNDVEVVSGREEVLIYDRPFSSRGLTWRELQSWWRDTNGFDEDEAKKSLYRRLFNCLPDNSPPQRLLFESYFKHFKHLVPRLPALLPEVWLHWDPKTVRERGKDALLRFRMDFLMLLPNGARIVIEVDGKEHYAGMDSKADPQKYAAMVAADRDLRLAGYDVYRFGAAELAPSYGPDAIGEFFERLFRAYRLSF